MYICARVVTFGCNMWGGRGGIADPFNKTSWQPLPSARNVVKFSNPGCLRRNRRLPAGVASFQRNIQPDCRLMNTYLQGLHVNFFSQKMYKRVKGNKLALSSGPKAMRIAAFVLFIGFGAMILIHYTMVRHFDILQVLPYCFINTVTYAIGGYWWLFSFFFLPTPLVSKDDPPLFAGI